MAEQKDYYIVVPAKVLYDKNLCASAKILYGEIIALCNKEGYCWASDKYFAKLYGVTSRSVSSWVSALKQKNYITVDLIYEKDSKEIKSRYIKIVENSTGKKVQHPVE